MADMNVDTIANAAGTGAPSFPYGALGVGGGGGSGGGQWFQPAGTSPQAVEENNERVFSFETALQQKVCLFYRVPSSYVEGAAITLRFYAYINATSGQFKFQTTAYLVKPGVDAVSSTTNSQQGVFEQNLAAPAETPYLVELAITDVDGEINNVAVAQGDIIRIELQRVDAGTENTADVKFVPSTSEVS